MSGLDENEARDYEWRTETSVTAMLSVPARVSTSASEKQIR